MQIGTCEHCDAQTVDGRCTRVMEIAFEKVADPEDWRGPIDAIIPFEELYDTTAAITFYTATVPTYQEWGKDSNGIRMVRVESEGYRAGPAGP